MSTDFSAELQQFKNLVDRRNLKISAVSGEFSPFKPSYPNDRGPPSGAEPADAYLTQKIAGNTGRILIKQHAKIIATTNDFVRRLELYHKEHGYVPISQEFFSPALYDLNMHVDYQGRNYHNPYRGFLPRVTFMLFLTDGKVEYDSIDYFRFLKDIGHIDAFNIFLDLLDGKRMVRQSGEKYYFGLFDTKIKICVKK